LRKENDRNAKVRRCGLHDAHFLVDGQHSPDRPFAKFVEVPDRGSEIFGNVLPLDGKVENALQAFEFAVYGRSFDGPIRIALGRLQPALIAIVLDHFDGDGTNLALAEKRIQVGEIRTVSLDIWPELKRRDPGTSGKFSLVNSSWKKWSLTCPFAGFAIRMAGRWRYGAMISSGGTLFWFSSSPLIKRPSEDN